MNTSFPVAALTVLGILTVVLGLFAAGDMLVVAMGFGALIAAGLIHALETRRDDDPNR
ncbi:MAG TPA: hypothetical protein VIW46_13790 [Acidimicrobiia bacterium]|jgi:hypothetical protein